MKNAIKLYSILLVIALGVIIILIVTAKGRYKRMIESNLKSSYTGIIIRKYENEKGFRFFEIASIDGAHDYKYCTNEGDKKIYQIAEVGDTIKKIKNCNILLLYKKSLSICFPYYDFEANEVSNQYLFEKACNCSSIKQ